MKKLSLNATDRATILYSVIVVLFTLIFRVKIAAYGCHLAFNLSVILGVLLLSLGRPSSSIKTATGAVSLWYPLILYGFFYYQTGLLNTVVVGRFLDSYFLDMDVLIFGQFPGLFLGGTRDNAFLDEFFHFFYFCYYLIIPMTFILLYRKDVKLFKKFVFQVSALFYVCYVIFIFLPVEGPISLRNEYYLGHGVFRAIVDFIWAKGENPGAGFPSSHVAITFLVAWWGSKHFKRLKYIYWLTFLFLTIATVYCMFHYAVDAIGGLLLGILAVFIFRWAAHTGSHGFICSLHEANAEDDEQSAKQ